MEKAQQIVSVNDGAAWIWSVAEEYFPTSRQIVDWFHAAQHLAWLAGVVRRVQELLFITRLATIIESFETEDAAVKSFFRPGN